MNVNWSEWLNLIVRWVHVFAGILWIGQTYFFTWLDRRLSGKGNPDRVWMVHSGGFYVVEKQAATEQPGRLRWFKWEAAITWISGATLLVLVYYMGGVLLDPDVADIGLWTGIGIGVASLIVGWVVYDLLWISPLARKPATAATISFLLLVGLAYGLTQMLSGRAAYLHVGAVMGTIMTANVWMRILPAQRRMVRAVAGGKSPDPRLADRAKSRSKHNTFMVVPVVFLMISSHFPGTYGHPHNWAILVVLLLAGAGAAKLLRDA